MRRSLRPSLGLLGAIASLHCLPGRLTAQAPPPVMRWEIGAPKAGWCIHFLMEPVEAAKDIAKGQRLTLARDAQGLPAAVSRLIRDEPQYAEWVAAEFCAYYAEAVWANNRRFDKGDGGQPVAFSFWGVSASAADGSPEADGVAFRSLATNSSGLRRAMEVEGVALDHADIGVLRIPETDDDQYRLKLEGAVIFVEGRGRSDSTFLVTPVHTTAAHRGNNNSVWKIDLALAPATVAPMSGALRIQGKRGLARALNRSPIRVLGPILSGGKGVMLFTK